MAREARAAMRVSPITDADVGRVGEFLHAHLNGRVPADDWARSLDVPWSVDSPNHGFMLLDDDTIVGAYLAFYSERVIGGRAERFCNLGAWCVLPDYRFHSLRLLNALLAQPRYHFTDLSPSGNTVPVNVRSKFQFLDTTTALIPNLPWPSWPGRNVISSDQALIARTLTGRDLEVYRDHSRTRAAHHVVLIRGGESCYVVFRRDRRRNLPLFVVNPPREQCRTVPEDGSAVRQTPPDPLRRPGDTGRAPNRHLQTVALARPPIAAAEDVQKSAPRRGSNRRPLQ